METFNLWFLNFDIKLQITWGLNFTCNGSPYTNARIDIYYCQVVFFIHHCSLEENMKNVPAAGANIQLTMAVPFLSGFYSKIIVTHMCPPRGITHGQSYISCIIWPGDNCYSYNCYSCGSTAENKCIFTKELNKPMSGGACG
uniref:SCP domain-containing protein n=1 Tax=Parastrongyloides trichosuri TaxID=131310 RepID=A0A0N5A704_PARTI